MIRRNYFITLLFIFLLSACATPTGVEVKIPQDAKIRESKLSSASHWNIRGKIAFITPEEKQSANINWQKRGKNQTLNITTSLGINILSVKSNDNSHELKVDGKKYRGDDLDHLIMSLTGLNLPVDALSQWIKAIHHSSADVFLYNQESNLPTRLDSRYNDTTWQVHYSHYRLTNDIAMPYQISVRKPNLKIKLKLNQWQFL